MKDKEKGVLTERMDIGTKDFYKFQDILSKRSQELDLRENEYINYSGGAKGSDIAWEIVGGELGIKTISMSFNGHKSVSLNNKILTDLELQEGWGMVLIVSKKMNRYLGKSSKYVRRLLSRNWFQVKDSESVFAIGRIIKPGEKGEKYKNTTDMELVDGGTGYATMMCIEMGKPLFVFDQILNSWYKWVDGSFKQIDVPTLTKNFTGIGTRNINDDGIDAIKSVYRKTFDITPLVQ